MYDDDGDSECNVVLVKVDRGAAAQHAPQLLRAEGSQSGDSRDDVGVPSATDAAAVSVQGGVARPSTSRQQPCVRRCQLHSGRR